MDGRMKEGREGGKRGRKEWRMRVKQEGGGEGRGRACPPDPTPPHCLLSVPSQAKHPEITVPWSGSRPHHPPAL